MLVVMAEVMVTDGMSKSPRILCLPAPLNRRLLMKDRSIIRLRYNFLSQESRGCPPQPREAKEILISIL